MSWNIAAIHAFAWKYHIISPDCYCIYDMEQSWNYTKEHVGVIFISSALWSPALSNCHSLKNYLCLYVDYFYDIFNLYTSNEYFKYYYILKCSYSVICNNTWNIIHNQRRWVPITDMNRMCSIFNHSHNK